MTQNIPDNNKKRIVIAGAGFGGLKLARKLSKQNYQIVLLDRNNYHQFQPLMYQVATSGIEPSAISFPLRPVFRNCADVHIRLAEILSVNTTNNYIETSIGNINYDFLVIATGVGTNFFGLKSVEENAIAMKSVNESLVIRNKILGSFEKAISCENIDERRSLMTIGVVGGGPTGVELCGTLAEMKKHVLPKDYPELDFTEMQIYLFEASESLLKTMSRQSSQKAEKYLRKLGVKVNLKNSVTDFDGRTIKLSDGSEIRSQTLIWASGIVGEKISGLDEGIYARGCRIKCNAFNMIEGLDNVFAIGDISLIVDEKLPVGHPQVAQVAIQQAENLAANFLNICKGKDLKKFKYKDLGTMATIGKNLAVVDLPFIKFHGFFAWLVWMFVHLMAIVGIKNRLFIFINWAWDYLTWDRSYRLIYKPKYRD
jgi:NADH dehydrogenase